MMPPYALPLLLPLNLTVVLLVKGWKIEKPT